LALLFSQMPQAIQFSMELPEDLARLRLPDGVQARLEELLTRQDNGVMLTDSERREAQGLVDLAELLSLLRFRSERLSAA
jgi:hypothetical protein